ncbi:sugar phosphate isomerase/epimerase family protein [Tengunoibacter tsumagoiensis]|uniref:Myo-inosose-2 dehydratase n=1 Tax=Tengunoibacter tsumagoiensis TaxID=2014871 RepID=A0A402A1E3_9CHLR|nr:sugar phosphate isomerase/epimerase family protein [Tengunoibacter tsumagoiensis]GCE12876.1 myo-inosose-2 dehydratase [Tengunoibacter tsumagoiensis]
MRFAQHTIAWGSYFEKNNLPFDWDLVFDEIKAAGYDGVELGGDESTLGSPEAFKRRLADHGLELAAFGSGVTANPHQPNTDQYRRELDYAAALGMKTIAVCGGFVPEQRRTMFESDYKLFAENLGAACEYARQYDQVIAFHPHTGCLVETIDEVKRLWKYLPNLHLCIDTGHLAAVRSNPIDLIHLAPDKISHFHLKDWSAQRRRFVELGKGDAGLDFKKLFQTLDDINYAGWLVVELDQPQGTALEAARVSREFLESQL